MFRTLTDSFIHEISLETTPQDQKELNVRLRAGGSLYNACLGESLRKISLIRQSHPWKKARKLIKSQEHTSERKELFKQTKKCYAYSEYELHAFVANLRKGCWIEKHLDSSTAQKIATKAFKAADEYLHGKRGKPRFKRYQRLKSIEGKSNASGIRWKAGFLIWKIRGGKTLKLSALFDLKDRDDVEKHALACRTKYCRLIRKIIRGKQRWYAQLVLEGKALQKKKNSISNDVVGLDIGPSTIAAVSTKDAFLKPFCQEIETDDTKLKKLQKKMSRSLRLNNPQNFKEDKTLKKGPKKWARSQRFNALQRIVAEGKRKLAQTRKRLHGEIANQVLSMGKLIKTEKLSYKSFQRNFGKSVGLRAPGMFISMLRRKAESAGGVMEEFSTYTTALSQSCHCGLKNKKELSERWHRCSCGAKAQRDLFSAHLARHVNNESLDTNQACIAWTAAEPLLERAVSRLIKLANGRTVLSSFGISQRQSQSHAKEGSLLDRGHGCCKRKLRAVERFAPCLQNPLDLFMGEVQ